MGRTHVLLLVFTVFSTLHAGCKDEGRVPAGKGRTSILLLTIDTLRADHLTSYGYARETAPFLSGLLKDSSRYTNAQSTSSWTAPALASLVTGVYPKSHGVLHGFVHQGNVLNQESLPATLPMLGEVLQKAGYATFGVVSNLCAREEIGFAKGFDRYRVLKWSPANAVNREVLRLKDEIASSPKPVFLWIHYFDPHSPYVAWEPWYRKHKQGDLAGAADLKQWDREQFQKLRANPDEFDAKELKKRLDLARLAYDSEIAYTDDQVRRLFTAMPFLNDWYLIVSSDHGEEFLDHGMLEHGFNLHRETLRVPLFLRNPRKPRPSVVPDVVSWIDLAPTIADLAGAEAPGNWQGLSLIGEKGPGSDRAVMASLYRGKRNALTVVDRRWKLIIDRKRKLTWLYDLNQDAGETKNLAAARPDIMETMGQKLKKLRKGAPVPASDADRKVLSEETRDQLRSLGYAE